MRYDGLTKPMKLPIVCLLVVAVWRMALPVPAIAASTTTPEVVRQIDYVPYKGEFVAALVMVPKTHHILYAYQPDKLHPAASLTKLANALVFMKRGISFDKKVTLLKRDEVGGGRLRVTVGTRLTVRDLFYSTITASANNTAMALARISGYSYATFLKQMNKAGVAAGLKHTVFYDAAGMDPRNMTTARDMALLGEAAFQQTAIRKAAGSPTYRMMVGSSKTSKVLTNTNDLLTKDPDVWVVGGKTGYLEESMYNLVTHVRPMDKNGRAIGGHDLIVVVLGSQTKQELFRSAKSLAQLAWKTY